MALTKLKTLWSQLKTDIKGVQNNISTINQQITSIDTSTVRLSWVSAVIEGLSGLGTFALVGIFFQKIVTNYTEKETPMMAFIIGAIAIFVGYTVATSLLRNFTRYKEKIFNDKLDYFFEQSWAKKMVSLDLGRLSDPSFHQLKEDAEYQGKPAVARLFQLQIDLFSGCVALVMAIGVISYLDPVLLFIAILPVIPEAIVANSIKNKRRKEWKDNHLNRKYKGRYKWFLSMEHTIMHSKLYRITEYVLVRYDFYSKKLRKSRADLEKTDFKYSAFVSLLIGIFMCISFAYLAHGFLNKTISFAEIFIIVGSISTLQGSLNRISRNFVDILKFSKDYEYFEEFMQTLPSIDETHARPFVMREVPTISFTSVSFNYPRQESKQALNNCSFVVAPREKIAIVGSNGSGKTTISRMMSKMYLPNSGTVYFDSLPTEHVFQETILEHIMLATQNPIIGDFTIDESITGSLRENIDLDRFYKAVTMSGVDDFVRDLPNGYKTQIGERWEDGVGFSSGQYQRMKLAATYYRLFDPKVFVAIFDEPMANCDIQTKEKFYHSVVMIPDKTIMVIAHDLAYLHNFERVLVIDNGSVVEDIRGLDAIEAYKERISFQKSELC